jgi:hypothetical protein
VIDQDLTGGPRQLTHPHWCGRIRCTADLDDGIHIGAPMLVPLGDDPADGLTLQLIQANASDEKPYPPVKLGIRWRGRYSRIPPIVIGLDRTVFFGEVLCRAARMD